MPNITNVQWIAIAVAAVVVLGIVGVYAGFIPWFGEATPVVTTQ